MAMSLTACNQVTLDLGDDEETTVGKGQLSLKSLVVDVTNATDNAEATTTTTRADGGDSKDSQAADVSTYTVRIIKKSTGVTAYEWLYSEMPEVVTLPVGEYTIEAFNEEVADVAWNKPYYYASEDCYIVADKVVEPKTLVCKLSSMRVSVKYSDALKALIGTGGSDVKVNVKAGSLSAEFAYTETGSVYFKNIGSDSTITVTFSGTVNGTYISEYKTVSKVNMGEHRIFNFDVQTVPEPASRVGQISADGLCLTASVSIVDLSRNVEVEEDVIESTDYLRLSQSTLNLEAAGTAKSVTVSASDAWTVTTSDSWLQVTTASTDAGSVKVSIAAAENTESTERTGTVTFRMGSMKSELTVTQAAKKETTPVAKDGPKITSSSSLVLDTPNQVANISDAVVDINATAGIKTFQVKISSTTDSFNSAIADMGLTDFDLANPGNLTVTLGDLGLPYGDSVKGQTSVKFDISEFMNMLKPFSGTHTFELIVTDNNGTTTSAKIIIVS